MMSLARILIVASVLLLSGCSYTFDILATMVDGRLTFIVDPQSARKPSSCLTNISVTVDDRPSLPTTQSDDEAQAFEQGYAWWNAVGYECGTRFPITYGVPLVGEPRSEFADIEVAARPLEPGVIYRVNATSGSTGYGEGRFKLSASGGVENVR